MEGENVSLNLYALHSREMIRVQGISPLIKVLIRGLDYIYAGQK